MPADGPLAILASVAHTPLGPLSLLAHGGDLVGSGFTGDPGELHARLHPSLGSLPLTAGDLHWAAGPVADYFDGDLTALAVLTVRQPAPPARERIWARLREVAPGTTVSYAGLAGRAGNPRAARTAGAACAANLLAPVIPCHRVLRTDGGLGGYRYGLARKEWLLRHEGALTR